MTESESNQGAALPKTWETACPNLVKSLVLHRMLLEALLAQSEPESNEALGIQDTLETIARASQELVNFLDAPMRAPLDGEARCILSMIEMIGRLSEEARKSQHEREKSPQLQKLAAIDKRNADALEALVRRARAIYDVWWSPR